MKPRSSLRPVGDDERIHVLDALRGFAIFGILIINVRVFSGYAYLPGDAQADLLWADWNAVFDWIHTVFFSGKFYTLFSLLFGVSFAIQFHRAASSDRSFTRHFSRRLFFLFLIGLVHLWGLWFSDILVLYALCGYLLLAFKGWSDRALLGAAGALLLVPGLHAWYVQTADAAYTTVLYQQLSTLWMDWGLPQASAASQTFQMQDVAAVIQSDSWATVGTFNAIGPVLRTYGIALDARLVKVLATFVLGLWVGRQLLQQRLHEHTSWLVRAAIVGWAVGLPLNVLYAMDNPTSLPDDSFLLLKDTLSPFAYVALTTGYVASFMLLFQTRLRAALDRLFNAVGKTALSNYLLQSVVGILLFYEVGLGLHKYLGSLGLTGATVAIFGVQILASAAWMQRYKYGPLEWVWRALTYGRVLPNRRS
ncbi:MAG: DUF418 domain-containing protein [Salinibacter sp.]